ncbi:hypothetical protein HDU82_000662 [Entophlyctis luteolus]|nr:hypothetical protein HDU82_000662 [Entophlyctis luteolus]
MDSIYPDASKTFRDYADDESGATPSMNLVEKLFSGQSKANLNSSTKTTFVTRKNINDLLNLCKECEMRFIGPAVEKPFRTVISIVTKIPWHNTSILSTIHRDHIFEMLKLSLDIAQEKLKENVADFAPSIINDMICCGMCVSGFTEKQKLSLLTATIYMELLDLNSKSFLGGPALCHRKKVIGCRFSFIVQMDESPTTLPDECAQAPPTTESAETSELTAKSIEAADEPESPVDKDAIIVDLREQVATLTKKVAELEAKLAFAESNEPSEKPKPALVHVTKGRANPHRKKESAVAKSEEEVVGSSLRSNDDTETDDGGNASPVDVKKKIAHIGGVSAFGGAGFNPFAMGGSPNAAQLKTRSSTSDKSGGLTEEAEAEAVEKFDEIRQWATTVLQGAVTFEYAVKAKAGKFVFIHKENLGQYFKACASAGVTETFDYEDLVTEGRHSGILWQLLSVKKIAETKAAASIGVGDKE